MISNESKEAELIVNGWKRRQVRARDGTNYGNLWYHPNHIGHTNTFGAYNAMLKMNCVVAGQMVNEETKGATSGDTGKHSEDG